MTSAVLIHFIINPNIENGYTIKTKYKDRTHIELIIYGKSTTDIFDISKIIKKELTFHNDHVVVVSYKNCPNMIKQSKKLKNRLIHLFSKPAGEYIKHVEWDYIQAYIDAYGKSPDFSKAYIPKIRNKIKNYIAHIINCEVDDNLLNNLLMQREIKNN